MSDTDRAPYLDFRGNVSAVHRARAAVLAGRTSAAGIPILSEFVQGWSGAVNNPALLLNHRSGRLSARGAHDILNAIADTAHLDDDFTSHVLRHTFGTTLVRQGHDLVLVAELLGHARLETVRAYSLPTDTDRQKAINSLLTDR